MLECTMTGVVQKLNKNIMKNGPFSIRDFIILKIKVLISKLLTKTIK